MLVNRTNVLYCSPKNAAASDNMTCDGMRYLYVMDGAHISGKSHAAKNRLSNPPK